jgi:hypothetical protein
MHISARLAQSRIKLQTDSHKFRNDVLGASKNPGQKTLALNLWFLRAAAVQVRQHPTLECERTRRSLNPLTLRWLQTSKDKQPK